MGPFYILPYFIINNPVIIAGKQPWDTAVMSILALIIAMGGVMCFAQRFCFTRIGAGQAVLFALAAVLATMYGLYHGVLMFVGAVILAMGLLAYQWRQRGRQRENAPKALAA